VGATATGLARHVTGTDEHAKADAVYFDRLHPNDPTAKEINGYRTNPVWHLFKVNLTGLWYFDTELFGEDRVAVPESEWK
jgi:hypothetical protein